MSLRGPASVLSAKLGARKIKDKNPYGIKVLKKIKSEESDKYVKEVLMSINMKKIRPLNGVKFLERILGIIPSVSLAKRLVVAQVKENCSFSKDGFVKPGDILKSIGNEIITQENLETILKNLNTSQLKLVFHEMLESSPLNSIDIKITTINDLLDNMHLLFRYERSLITMMSETEHPSFCLMYISKLEESDDSSIMPKFCFPVKERNVLFAIRGSFLTLQSILENNLSRTPISSTFKIHRSLFHVTYTRLDNGILMMGFNAKYTNLKEAKQHANNFISAVKFLFTSEGNAIDTENVAQFQQLCELKSLQLTTGKKFVNETHFEDILPQPQYVALPKEIQLRIDDAISELEAMDFFNWTDSDTVIDALQDLIIIGCALYYHSYLISSHLSVSLIHEIESIANHLVIHQIMDSTNVKKMIVWQQIYPKDEPKNGKKRFVIFTSQSNLMMVSVLEEKLANAANDSSVKTSLSYYVEEMQDILEYFRLTGVENLTRIWVTSNKRPEILQLPNGDIVNAPKSTLPTFRDTISDDSDSDWEEARSSSGFDMSECSDIIYKDFQEIIPNILNRGTENLMFHFVQIEYGEGIIVAPTLQSNFISVCNNFRKACVIIHQVLQNTVKFRQQLADNEKPTSGRQLSFSMVAIKEHGMLFHVAEKNGKNEKLWVIGRLFSVPHRELYVCMRSGTPQNMIELAFKICMGGAG